ncbi:uncharacterized protein LOC143181976 [Calliopsis andreniformis]|uniref:uncharacterized protein LOC143181976 n=1 Tax=Calliopsis andreniformis TaxID=337506 RepID=UPI003FCEE3E0
MENEGSPSAVEVRQPEGRAGWVESIILRTLQTSIGQSLFKLIDSCLWVIEKSAQWSLPAHEITAEENGKVFGKVELVRPLPWILFLPGLVILRIIRGGLNVGAFVLGYPQIQPIGMVKFMQKGRRRLRTIQLKAVKCGRRKISTNKDKRLTMIEAKKALIRSIRLTLSTLSCLDASKSSPSPPPTRIRISGLDLETLSTPDEKSTTESAGSPIHMEVKRKYSQVSSATSSDESEEETLQSKIDRLAQDDSSDDPDFNPVECSPQSSTSSEEEDANISLTEVKEIKKEAEKFYREHVEETTVPPVDQKSSNEAEKMAANIERVDSPEPQECTTSSITNDFINEEINSATSLSTAMAPPPPPPPQEIIEEVPTIPSDVMQIFNSLPSGPQSHSQASRPAMQEKKHGTKKKEKQKFNRYYK